MRHIFASRLGELRMKAGISQKKLALTLKIGPGSMSNYENGIYLPPLEKASAMAKELHTSLDYLTGLTDTNLDPELLSRPISEKITFIHVIKLLSTLERKDLAEIMNYAEYLKYKRKRASYTKSPTVYRVA
ncbi:MAG: helix-turn-helix transcriptional regulator [Lachnospiraceae bacterium]|nr:helix-turn-helix transcriptional regulator [Lachnospiraceae bacterium]